MASRFTGNILGDLVNRTNLDADDESRRAENRALRNVYVFGLTIVCLIGSIAITLLGFDSAVAELTVDGLFGLAQLTVVFFLSTASIDRSEVLTNFGKGIRARAEQPQIIVQTPEEARAAAAATTVTTTGPVTVDNGDNSVG